MKGLEYWHNINKEVVKTYDVMTESLQDPAKVIGDRYKPSHNVTKAVKTYEEELYNRLTAMIIDSVKRRVQRRRNGSKSVCGGGGGGGGLKLNYS